MTARRVNYRKVIADCLEIWRAGVDRGNPIVRLDVVDFRVPLVVRGLVAHAADCADGVLTLYRAGKPVPAIPLVRALIEDTVTAAWVYAVEDAWKAFASNGARSRVAALRELQTYDPTDLAAGEQLAQAEELIESLGKTLGYSVQQRIDALEGTENWYLMYRAASTLTHAGSGVVDLYIETQDDSPVGVALRNHASFSNASSYLAVGATSFFHTLMIWDLCQVNRPDRVALEEIAERIGVGTTYRARTT